MIVDPNTGLPMGDPQVTAANTIGGQIAMDAAQTAGYTNQDLPLFYDIAGSLPAATSTGLWNVGRVSRSITQGPLRHRSGRGGYFRQGAIQTSSPRSWGRLSRAANIDPSFYENLPKGDVRKASYYSPFGILSKSGNLILNRAAQHSEAIKSRLDKYLPITDSTLKRSDGKPQYFERGTLGRISSLSSIGSMNDTTIKSRFSTILNSVKDINPNVYDNFMQGQVSGNLDSFIAGTSTKELRGIAQAQVLNTMNGAVTGRIGGYVAGSTWASQGAEYTAAQLARVTSESGRIGAQAAVRHAGGGEGISKSLKFIGQNARFAAPALRAASIAGNVMLVHDLALLTGKVVGRGLKNLADAGQSMVGSLNKPIMGMGYRDNSVAATSRQRGVMAIQNSRLNMRSVLGSEAAAIHAYYG